MKTWAEAYYPNKGLVCQKFYASETGIASLDIHQVEKYTQTSITEITAPVWQLCDSRHDNPIANQGGLFPRCLMNPMDVLGMENILMRKIEDVYICPNTMFCVVTGMTTALVALINVCARKHIRLVLLHYDIVHDAYHMQVVINYKRDERAEIIEGNSHVIDLIDLLAERTEP